MRAENSTLTGTVGIPDRGQQLWSDLGGRLKNDIGNTNAHENRMRHTALPLWKIEHQISKIVSPGDTVWSSNIPAVALLASACCLAFRSETAWAFCALALTIACCCAVESKPCAV